MWAVLIEWQLILPRPLTGTRNPPYAVCPAGWHLQAADPRLGCAAHQLPVQQAHHVPGHGAVGRPVPHAVDQPGVGESVNLCKLGVQGACLSIFCISAQLCEVSTELSFALMSVIASSSTQSAALC